MADGDDEDDGKRKPNKAKIEDDFLRHPYTGSLVRNPLRVKDKSVPIIWAKEDYEHNCLDEALYGWKQIRVDETSLNKLIDNDGAVISPRTLKKRVHLGRIDCLSSKYEFIVNLEKADFVEPKLDNRRRRGKEPPALGTKVEKLLIEINEKAKGLKIESIAGGGLVFAWNTNNPRFLVQVGDFIMRVNGKKGTSQMLEELAVANSLRLTIDRRPPGAAPVEEGTGSRLGSKRTSTSKEFPAQETTQEKPPAADQTHHQSADVSPQKGPEEAHHSAHDSNTADQTLKPSASGSPRPRSGRPSKRQMPPPKPVMPFLRP